MANANYEINEIPSGVVTQPTLAALFEIEQGGVSRQTNLAGVLAAINGQHVAYSGAAATVTLTTGMNYQLSSNIGATGIKTLALPEATVGLLYGALRQANYAVRFEPLGSNVINDGVAGKYLELVDYGTCWLQCLSAGIWSQVDRAALTTVEA